METDLSGPSKVFGASIAATMPTAPRGSLRTVVANSKFLSALGLDRKVADMDEFAEVFGFQLLVDYWSLIELARKKSQNVVSLMHCDCAAASDALRTQDAPRFLMMYQEYPKSIKGKSWAVMIIHERP